MFKDKLNTKGDTQCCLQISSEHTVQMRPCSSPYASLELLVWCNYLFIIIINSNTHSSVSGQMCGGEEGVKVSDLLVMRVGCCRTRSRSRPSLSSSRLRAMSASWPMTPNASSRFRNMENSLCRCRVPTRIASVIRPVETRSNRVISAQGITNLTEGGEKRVKRLSFLSGSDQ